MIKELVIENFQSHKGSILHFDKGVNIIVGTSDSGKTAIIRALRWAMTNKPSGEEFRSYWGGDTSVTVAVGDSNKKHMGNKVVQRIKADKGNTYLLDEEKFAAFGQNVPEEIQKVFNINEVNLQGQLDAPFLLSSSPGDVAQHFNKVANLELIDSSIKRATSEINSLQGRLNGFETELNRNESAITNFIDLDTCEEEVKNVEILGKQLDELGRNSSRLQDIVDDYYNLIVKLEEYNALLSLEQTINEILDYYSRLATLNKECGTLAILIKDLHYHQNRIKTYNNLIANELPVTEVLNTFAQIEELEKAYKKLHNMKYELSTVSIKIRYTEQKIEKLETEYKENFPEICPLCGSHVEEVIL